MQASPTSTLQQLPLNGLAITATAAIMACKNNALRNLKHTQGDLMSVREENHLKPDIRSSLRKYAAWLGYHQNDASLTYTQTPLPRPPTARVLLKAGALPKSRIPDKKQNLLDKRQTHASTNNGRRN